MTAPKRTAEEIEEALAGMKYGSREEAVAAALAMSEPGDEVRIHDHDCEIDGEDYGCTCTPAVIVAGERPEA